MAVPTFVYKIIPSSSPLPAILPDILPPSDLDQKDGFIHLSTASQILGTLKLVFKDDTKVYVLKIEYSKVEKDVKWEEGSCVPGVTEGGIIVIIELRHLTRQSTSRGVVPSFIQRITSQKRGNREYRRVGER